MNNYTVISKVYSVRIATYDTMVFRNLWNDYKNNKRHNQMTSVVSPGLLSLLEAETYDDFY